MTKIIFAIFAHPDDESFGPSGTLITEVESGTQVHLVTLTAGQAGMNPDNYDDLAKVRLNEWHKAGQLIGASSQHHLGYKDGQLNNETMQQASQKIIDLVRDIATEADQPLEIEFMTSDLNGISGHIDHIVAARAACFAFYKLRESGLNMSRIRLACVPRSTLPKANTNWLYMEPGRLEDEIDEVIDASKHYERIVEIVRTHHTQRKDGESHIKRQGESLAINHFIILD